MLPLSLHPRPIRGAVHRLIDNPLATVTLVILFAALVVMATRGQYVTWDGVQTIPTELPSCGDYCGSDAGFITEPAR